MTPLSSTLLWSTATLGILGMSCAGATLAEAQGGEGDRLALFVGINSYPRLEGQSLNGCVADARAMELLFRTRFGFTDTTMLLDEQATRAGIGAAFEDLVARARATAETGAQPTVLVFYAGHGSQVRDQAAGEPGCDEPEDGRDETWVAHDSSWQGDHDVRDDEIQAFLHELVTLGAQVLFVSDSCHSGTVHRSASFAPARTLRMPEGEDELRSGPTALLRPPSPRTRGGDEPQAGYVSLTACADTQSAYEHLDEAKRPCGRFTWVLRRVLADLPPSTSYDTLHRRVVAEFVKNWPDLAQTPKLGATAAKRGEVFIAGGYPPPHARILPEGRREGVVRVDAGYLHGSAVGARVEFYPGLAELEARRGALGGGTVDRAEFEASRVLLDEGVSVPDDAVARVDAARMADFRVALAPDLPDLVRERLGPLHDNGELTLAEAGEEYRLYVRAHQGGLAVYGPSALPDEPGNAERGDPGRQPPPLWTTQAAELEGAVDALAERLTYLTRFQRLMTLARNESEVSIGIKAVRKSANGEQFLEPPAVDGIPRFEHKDIAVLRFENRTGRRLYIHLLAVDASAGSASKAQPIYPRQGEEPEAVEPHSVRVFLKGDALADADLERTTLKLLATDRPIEIWGLLRPPQERPPTRGASDPLVGLLDRALHGGGRPTTRSFNVAKDGIYWATSEVVFEVVRER